MLTLLRGVSGSLDGVDIFWTPMLLGASGSLGVNTFDSADIPCWSILPRLMLTRFLIFMISEEEDSMLELLAIITALPVSKLLICLKGGGRLLRLSRAARSASAPLEELLPRR